MNENGEKCQQKSALNVDFLLTLTNKCGIFEEKKQVAHKHSKNVIGGQFYDK